MQWRSANPRVIHSLWELMDAEIWNPVIRNASSRVKKIPRSPKQTLFIIVSVFISDMPPNSA